MPNKLDFLREINSFATQFLKWKFSQKWFEAKRDRRHAMLIVTELILSILLAIAFVVYVERESQTLYNVLNYFHTIGWMKSTPDFWIDKIPEPPFSYVLFALWFCIVFWLYSLTGSFRQLLGKGLFVQMLRPYLISTPLKPPKKTESKKPARRFK